MNLVFLINYIKTMKIYFYFLLLQLALIVTLMAYVFAGFDENRHTERIVLGIECALTMIIVCEILLKIILNKKEFFKNVWNIIDAIGVSIILSLFFVLMFFEAASGAEREEDDMIPAILLAIRYCTQVVRIILNLKQNKAFRDVANLDIIFENEKEMTDTTDQEKKNCEIDIINE